MSAIDMSNAAATENQAFALMSRLHVILRRERGRVTDIEYMRIDAAYCRHVLALARTEDASDDLLQICARIEEIYFGPNGLFVKLPPKPPLIERRATQRTTPEPPPDESEPATVTVSGPTAYVGRLR
jgi:hypothetical protein